MSLCTSIDTLSMAYLDDELAGEERRELELHLLECSACRAHLDAETADMDLVRGALVAPPMPDMVRARIAKSLDAEDSVRKKSWTRFLLPGSAMVAAAAALAVFVSVRPSNEVSETTRDVARQSARPKPLEVQGASTGPWLRQHFAPTMQLPTFETEPVQLLGARLTDVNGHDAAMLQYKVSLDDTPLRLSAVVVQGLGRDELSGGQAIEVGDRVLHLVEIENIPAVTYVDQNNTGYVFMAERLTANELVRLVVSSNLIDRAQKIR